MMATGSNRMCLGKILALVVAACAGTLMIASCSRGSDEIPELSARSSYVNIFEQFDQAEAKTDPIERCMSYPTPQHLPWPQTLVSALCADLFTPVMQAGDIKQMIDGKDWKALHDRYSGYLERHYSGADPEKLLYRAFPKNSWKSDDEADRYTRKWVSARPDDPFANTARGSVLVSAAWMARGNGYYREIPEANRRKMYKLALQASVHLRKAIILEPRLLPAYSELIDAYLLGGKSEWIAPAAQAAIRQSPDTYYVREPAAEYVRKKWGGSPSDMDALIKNAEQHLKQNPRLGMIRSVRELERGDMAIDRKEYKSAMASYRKALTSGPDHEALVMAAFVAPKLGYKAEKIVYLTQDIRFSRDPRDSLMQRAAMWESDNDFERALRDYATAKKYYPIDAEIDKRIAEAKVREQAMRKPKGP